MPPHPDDFTLQGKTDAWTRGVQTCIDCRYFHNEKEWEDDGFCRANPPLVMYVPDEPHPEGTVPMLTVWPVVQKNDWCGRFVSSTGD